MKLTTNSNKFQAETVNKVSNKLCSLFSFKKPNEKTRNNPVFSEDEKRINLR